MKIFNFKKQKDNSKKITNQNEVYLKIKKKYTNFVDVITLMLRHSKINVRLFFSILGLSLVVLLIASNMFYQSSSKSIKDKIGNYSIQMLKQISKYIELDTEKFVNFTNDFCTDPIIETTYTSAQRVSTAVEKRNIIEKLNTYISQKLGVLNNSVSYIKIQYDENLFTDYGNNNEIPKTEIPEIIKRLDDNKEGTINLEFYEDTTREEDNQRLIISKKIISLTTAKKIGYMILVLNKDYIFKQYKDVDLGNGVNIFMISDKGKAVSSNNSELLSKSSFVNKNFVSQIETNLKSNLQSFPQSLNKEDHLVTFSNITGHKWYLASTIPYSYLNKESNKLLVQLIYIFLIGILITILLSYFLTKSISDPLYRLVKTMKKAKDGDFTTTLVDDGYDEISDVIGNFNEMLSNIRVLILDGKKSANQVLNGSETINYSTKHLSNISNSLSDIMAELSKASSQQASEIFSAVDYMNNLSQGINKMDEDTNKVYVIADETSNICQKSLITVDELKNRSNQTAEISNKIVNEILELSDEMKKIRRILKLINTVADQTQLVSLNAAIQAGKAGVGSGFAVVTSEIKKLSFRSKNASKTIGDMLVKFDRKVKQTAQNASEAIKVLEFQKTAVSQTDRAFADVVHSMNNIFEQLDNVNKYAKSVIELKDKTLFMLESIASVSEEVSSTASDVSDQAVVQLNIGKEILNSTIDMNNMAIELNKSIEVFKIKR